MAHAAPDPINRALVSSESNAPDVTIMPASSRRGAFPLPLWCVHAALVFVQVANGGYHVAAKMALQDGVDQLVFCCWRDVVALMLLLPAAVMLERGNWMASLPSHMHSLLLLGATGILGNQLFFMLGLNFTGPATSAALQPSIPVFTFILAVILRLEQVDLSSRHDAAKLLGVAVCVSGAVLMALYRGPAIIAGSDLIADVITNASGITVSSWGQWSVGVSCLVVNCTCMAAYLILQAAVLRSFPYPIAITAMAYLFGAALMLIIALFAPGPPSKWLLSAPQLAAVLYAGVISSALNYSLTTWANKRMGPALVALYNPLQPFSSALLSHLILGSSIFLSSLAGGTAIICGLYLVVWGKRGNGNKVTESGEHERLVHREDEQENYGYERRWQDS